MEAPNRKRITTPDGYITSPWESMAELKRYCVEVGATLPRNPDVLHKSESAIGAYQKVLSLTPEQREVLLTELRNVKLSKEQNL